MPKVKNDYFAAKKREIVTAAMRVCESKPAYSITLRDVVRECGISTGGIYNYFSSIDEIFVEILNQAYEEISVGDGIKMLFESGKSPCDIVMDFLIFRGKLIDRMYKKFGKLIFDVQAICINDPERGRKMLAGLKGNDDGYDSFTLLKNYIDERIADGSFECAVPKEHILFILVVASDGIKKAFVDPDSADELAMLTGISKDECVTAECMMKVLAQAIVKLLVKD
ncbi:MAG: TetR/AcrR family transcriptional regulator [Defluviitaleaceae bacterium]|nr:TetR/AcrR family transcriptional regulator [Defluviitaleaceae bacterium]